MDFEILDAQIRAEASAQWQECWFDAAKGLAWICHTLYGALAVLSLAPGFSRVQKGQAAAASAACGTWCRKPLKRFPKSEARPPG